jgi:hypothetical protein
MARIVHVNDPSPHASIARLQRAGRTFGTVTALGALLFTLAAIGSLVFRIADRLRLGYAGWAQGRRRREEDRQLWALALTDSRVMADLVALSQQTPGEASGAV